MTTIRLPKFESLALSTPLLEVVRELGYLQPTPIQLQSIPILLEGKDVIAQSQTGSGKTAAYGLPILQGIRITRQRNAQALVLCPTRELCAQVARELRKLGRKSSGLQVLILAGGTPIGPQFDSLEKGAHILVGTPGRILDHLGRGSLQLSDIKTLVLDEADRMLEMGFSEDMKRIISHAPKNRQTVMFSATFPKAIESLSRLYQVNPIRVTITQSLNDGPDEKHSRIRHHLYESEMGDRQSHLLSIIRHLMPESAIVFCNFKASVANLARALSQSDISVGELHGDLEQKDRDRIMAKFRNRSLRLLVATDVAARGIDVSDLDLVVNYELPTQSEIYVHRAGRTGRAGKQGLAISLYSLREKAKVERIEKETGTRFSKQKIDTTPLVNSEKSLSRESINAAMKTLYISGGRKEKMRPGDILGALTGEGAGFSAKDIGKIEIHDHFSYVAVAADVAEAALNALRNGRIKGRKFRVEAVK